MFQGLLLIGLCNREDLITSIFSLPQLAYLGEFSFPQYCFQFLVWAWFTSATGEQYVDHRYFMLLFATAVAITIISATCRKRLSLFVACITPLFIAYFMMQSYWAAASSSSFSFNQRSVHPPSTFFHVSSKYYNDSTLIFNYEYDGRWNYKTFNPSIINVNGLFLLAARRGFTTSQHGAWFNQSTILNTWDTNLVLTVFQTSNAMQSAVVVDIKFKPCMPEPVCNKNGTTVFKITTQPEDPRFFFYNGSFYITMFSYDNIVTNVSTEYKLSRDYIGDYGTGTDVCTSTADGLIGRMYILKVPSGGILPCMFDFINSAVPVLQNQTKFPKGSITKNWLAFTFINVSSSREHLYFIYQISPVFVIMEVDNPDSEIAYSYEVFRTDTPSFISQFDTYTRSGSLNDDSEHGGYLASHVLPSNIHGSVNPIFFSDQYVSIFHVLSDNVVRNYATYVFAFCPEPPFKIISVSKRPLRLYLDACQGSKAPMAFVSGLTLGPCTGENQYSKNCFIVSYGVCDESSRVIRINATAYMDLMMIAANKHEICSA